MHAHIIFALVNRVVLAKLAFRERRFAMAYSLPMILLLGKSSTSLSISYTMKKPKHNDSYMN